MKIRTLALLSIGLIPALGYSTPADDLAAAIGHLNAASSLTWIVKPDRAAPRTTPIEWQTDQQGWILGRWLSDDEPWSVSDGSQRFVRKQGRWTRTGTPSLPEDASFLRARAAVENVTDIAGALLNIRIEGDAIVGDLKPEFAARQLTFDSGPPTDASGSARFWVKDGVLQRYQVHRQGTIRHRGETRAHNTTIEVQFTNIGSTKVVVPTQLRALFGA